MDYKVYEDGGMIALRLDPGEEICESLLALADKESIQAATVYGLGATDDAVIGIMDVKTKEYKKQSLKEPLEITTLVGNLSRKDGEAYLHAHINLGGTDGKVMGGHLDRAVISVTAEIFVRPIRGIIDRVSNEAIGINQMIF
ncbi:MAG: PPC domain-containing DNA-binding protein [Peptoniphilus sp.]|nr:PPC domain-containing DNA-binding protein [Peptoniphilus sp.]MDY3117979.1 PPC domain-containing DNA-binding protein [Peptoniphilus sp.]